jgi:hypothetical protein
MQKLIYWEELQMSLAKKNWDTSTTFFSTDSIENGRYFVSFNRRTGEIFKIQFIAKRYLHLKYFTQVIATDVKNFTHAMDMIEKHKQAITSNVLFYGIGNSNEEDWKFQSIEGHYPDVKWNEQLTDEEKGIFVKTGVKND